MAVEIEEYIPNATEKPRTIIRSDKFKHEFIVQPSIGGYVFYEIKTTASKVPEELNQRYTRMKYAVDAVKDYERRAPKSQAVQRDEKAEKRHAAKLQRERTSDLHQGADNGEVGTDLPGERLNG